MPGPGPEEARNVPMAFMGVNDAHSWSASRSEGEVVFGEGEERWSWRDISANSGRPLRAGREVVTLARRARSGARCGAGHPAERPGMKTKTLPKPAALPRDAAGATSSFQGSLRAPAPANDAGMTPAGTSRGYTD